MKLLTYSTGNFKTQYSNAWIMQYVNYTSEKFLQSTVIILLFINIKFAIFSHFHVRCSFLQVDNAENRLAF